MNGFTKLPRPRCEAVCAGPYISVGWKLPDIAGRQAEGFRCSKNADYRIDATGQCVCTQHRNAILFRRKPVEFIPYIKTDRCDP